MDDTKKIKIKTITIYEEEFKADYSNYKNVTYSTFLSCYLKNCSDPTVLLMASKLSDEYTKIDNGYKNIDKWWSDYISQFSNTEKSLKDKLNIPSTKLKDIIKNANIPDKLNSLTNKLSQINDVQQQYNATQAKNRYGGGGAHFPDGLLSDLDDETMQEMKQQLEDSRNEESSFIKLYNKIHELEKPVAEFVEKKLDDWQIDDDDGTVEKIFKTGATNAVKICSTVSTFIISTSEGGLKYIENDVDFVALVIGNVFDIDGTDEFIAKDYVGDFFDLEYEENPITKLVGENSFGFDTTRQVGNTTGKIASFIVELFLAKGLGELLKGGGKGVLKFTGKLFGKNAAKEGAEKAVKEGTEKIGKEVAEDTAKKLAETGAKKTAEAGAKTASQKELQKKLKKIMAILGFEKGTGAGAEEAYANGASDEQAIAYALLNGVWSAVQAYAGAEISSKISSPILRIVLDGVDGGLDPIVKSLFDLIWKDGYYDENGNYIEFTNESLPEKYSKSFKDEGGWSSVLQNIAVSMGFSGVGELTGHTKKLFGDNTGKENADTSKLNGPLVTENNQLMNKFGEMYDDDLNSLVQFFKTEGEYTDDQIKNLFDNSSKDNVVKAANDIANKNGIYDLNTYLQNVHTLRGLNTDNLKNNIPNSYLDSVNNLKNNIDDDIINEMSDTFKKAGYTPEQIKNMFANEDVDTILQKYNKLIDQEVNAKIDPNSLILSENDLNKIKTTFEKVGYTQNEIDDMFSSKDVQSIVKDYNKLIDSKLNMKNLAKTDNDLFLSIFKEEGYTDEEIKKLLSENSSDDVIYKALEITKSDDFKEKALKNNNPVGIGEYGGKEGSNLTGWYNVFYSDQGLKILVPDNFDKANVNYTIKGFLDGMENLKNEIPMEYDALKDYSFTLEDTDQPITDSNGKIVGQAAQSVSAYHKIFQIYACCEDGEINEILYHEGAHAIDGINYSISNSLQWRIAMVKDQETSNPASISMDGTVTTNKAPNNGCVTYYAGMSKEKYTKLGILYRANCEDFADSVKLFKQMGEERFKRKFPYRYKILKEKGY